MIEEFLKTVKGFKLNSTSGFTKAKDEDVLVGIKIIAWSDISNADWIKINEKKRHSFLEDLFSIKIT